MNKILLSIAVFTASFASFAQTQYSAYSAVGKGVATTFLTDYQCLGINSSALGWNSEFEGKHFTVGTSEFAFGVYSDALNKERVKNASQGFWNNIRDKDNASFDFAAQKEAAAQYADAGLAINFDYNWFGGSVQFEKLGGIAISVREDYDFFGQLNEETSDIIFRGRIANYFDSLTVVFGNDTSTIANRENISQDTLSAVIYGELNVPLSVAKITEGSRIKMRWNREFNFGYGRKIFGNDEKFALYGGIGGRFIQSMALYDLESDGQSLTLSSALSPVFDIDFGNASTYNPSNFTGTGGGLPEVVGNGYGIDISASVKMLDKITLAASVNNIGSITYTRNVYSVKDTLVGRIDVAGLDQTNITEAINKLMEDGGLLTLEGEEKYTAANAATFRMGGSIKPFEILDVGFDLVAPFDKDNPGSIQNAVISVGGDIKVAKFMTLSAGYFGGGIYKNNIPVGIRFTLKNGTYECGISSRDALSFFLKDGNSVSTAFGFARFRF